MKTPAERLLKSCIWKAQDEPGRFAFDNAIEREMWTERFKLQLQ